MMPLTVLAFRTHSSHLPRANNLRYSWTPFVVGVQRDSALRFGQTSRSEVAQFQCLEIGMDVFAHPWLCVPTIFMTFSLQKKSCFRARVSLSVLDHESQISGGSPIWAEILRLHLAVMLWAAISVIMK